MGNFYRKSYPAGFVSFLILTAQLLVLTAWLPARLEARSGRAVTTARYNNSRNGWNPSEVILNISNVNHNSFGKKWSTMIQGEIKGSPLYVSDVLIAGQRHNVLYVATENNLIYALDADSGAELWPIPNYLGVPGNIALLPDGCGSIGPNIGITSTPVIDLEGRTLYAVGLTLEAGRNIFKMAAVDIATGRSRPGWPIVINPPASPSLDTRVSSNRGALLLANDMVYVPFGGYAGDCGDYHGWVVGIQKANPQAPQLYYRTPGIGPHVGSGIWSSGGFPADEDGNLYPATGNSFNAPALDYSNSVLRLRPNLSFSETARDFFTPSNWVDLNDADDDLGSSTAIIIPRQPSSRTPNMLFIAGKRGVGHLINLDAMGGVASGDGVSGEGVYSRKVAESVFSTAAYYEDPILGPMLFLTVAGNETICGPESRTAAMTLRQDSDGNSYYQVIWCTPPRLASASPLVTSAPGQTGILWVVSRRTEALHAFNAASGEELYNSNMVPGDELGGPQKFLNFIAVDGKIFLTNEQNEVMAYGLREARFRDLDYRRMDRYPLR
ncbi:MAG: PQQ-binding-like beta-propeller repeat protein [Acidobacteria bacterium]|nr:PQQ-binding-like beta-propeller repeat protein [Acidobacteriota bacterium]MBI3656518.1 PQQ-binding-like beta-propeller repeat protein [Acidobacteriota bacterium]